MNRDNNAFVEMIIHAYELGREAGFEEAMFSAIEEDTYITFTEDFDEE